MKIVRHSPDRGIGGKVLFWGAARKLSVMSTRWR